MERSINIFLYISGGLSIIGTLGIIITYLSFKSLRSLRYVELAFYVAVNDFCAALEVCMGSAPAGTVNCWLQGFLTSYSFLASVMWNAVIAYQIFIVVHRRGDVIRDLTWAHVVCWIFPLIASLLPLTTNTYGYDEDSWCFIAKRSGSPSWGIGLWEILSFFLWLWLLVIFIAVLFILILLRLRDIQPGHKMSVSLYRIGYAPVVLLICWAVPSFLALYRGISGFSYSGVGTYELHAISVGLPPMQGLLMSIAFFRVNSLARREWWYYLTGEQALFDHGALNEYFDNTTTPGDSGATHQSAVGFRRNTTQTSLNRDSNRFSGWGMEPFRDSFWSDGHSSHNSGKISFANEL